MRLLIVVNAFRGEIVAAARIARERGAAVAQAGDVEGALLHLRAKGADLVLCDVGSDVAALRRALDAERFALPILACGTSPDSAAAVAAIRAGARDYIPLPPDPALIAAVLEAVAREASGLIHRDEAMARVVALAERVAASDASVLVTGESGVGKEVIARHLHARSRRAAGPFVSVNCAAIPDQLLESELFGHEKGAFTGALGRRVGRFEEAEGGTLLLDEVSEMEVRLQAKLLRALQERVIDRVGGTKPVPVNIRVIATSNRDLSKAVKDGSFREDLLYRLNVVTLRVPSLRERPGDVLPLAAHFARKYALANGLPERSLSHDAKRKLLGQVWRGNVRELENTVHRAVLLSAGDEIDADAVSPPEGQPAPEGPADRAAMAAQAATRALVGRTVGAVEQDLILDTLDHCLGNRTHAARILGISIRTLRNKLNEYGAAGVPVPPPGEARVAAA